MNVKCTIKGIWNRSKNGVSRSKIEGFIPMEDMSIIPEKIMKWMYDYEGVTVTPVFDKPKEGIVIIATAETACSPRDNFDEEKGLHIAESKAKKKIYLFMKWFTKFMADHYEKISGLYSEAYLKYDHCYDHELEHTQFLSTEEDELTTV